MLDGIKGGEFLFIKIPKGTPVIPMDIVTEKQMISENSINAFGGGDIGYEESEMLMPMCDIEVNNHYQAPKGKTMANATIVKQKNSIEIMEKRLEEMKNMIVQHGGQEKLEKLLEEKISFNQEEILDVKWISKEEVENMSGEDLRDEKLIKEKFQIFLICSIV